MKQVTLVTRRLYFGIDPYRLREATERVLSRIDGVPHERAAVRVDALVEDFRIGAAASQTMIDEMVRKGLLQRRDERGREYAVTDTFRLYAGARIVDPLGRALARGVIEQVVDQAWRFNRTASNNKYEIDAIAVFGAYMSTDAELPELSLGVTGRRRPPAERPAAGRATMPTEGHDQIRRILNGQSSYIETHFYQRLADVPRPFSVIFRSDS
jgi:hypothetical protein